MAWETNEYWEVCVELEQREDGLGGICGDGGDVLPRHITVKVERGGDFVHKEEKLRSKMGEWREL
jgi:hypothetical protein